MNKNITANIVKFMCLALLFVFVGGETHSKNDNKNLILSKDKTNMKVKLDFLYIEGCPNSTKLLAITKEAIKGLENKVILNRILVNSEAKAKKLNFNGSPSLRINDIDLEGKDLIGTAGLSCRYYPNGLPSAMKIRQNILTILENNEAKVQ